MSLHGNPCSDAVQRRLAESNRCSRSEHLVRVNAPRGGRVTPLVDDGHLRQWQPFAVRGGAVKYRTIVADPPWPYDNATWGDEALEHVDLKAGA